MRPRIHDGLASELQGELPLRLSGATRNAKRFNLHPQDSLISS
jgi:hypothetical protein